jgi:hypothetical protein
MPVFAGIPSVFPDVLKQLVLWLEPTGGQAVARRNAWSALVVDVRRRAERLEADRAATAALADRQQHAAAV